ncbi:regulator of G-protein signaling 9 isoform X1 [Trichogramma pretiosum]|uniref:regulator of G-protein signaling 9 isoform X1 n=1 Tax=Trichogramma pretiosum TaxID=7493 RepID=UPI000C71B49B|nr:regulator of G-protein signaling 9 isoform X1 [Trichogramma pretiosum]XP_023317557.1 regulator of G-protein signaling 9 isoform X1 [Trichogramma pretiosum]
MEGSSALQPKERESRVHRPCAFDKMEGLVREMQDPENGVPVRSQKLFLTSIPSAFMGYDLIEWLMDRLNIEESVEAVHIANQLCQYGYFFPVNDSRTLTVKDDSSLYRFQTPYYWPWQHKTPDNVEYAIYLAKRTLRNKQRHGLEEYELEALSTLKNNLQKKWELIQLQADEQVRLSKDRKKGDKIVSDSQERAFWRVYRPPPGCTSSLEMMPIPNRARPGIARAPPRKRTLNDLQREVIFILQFHIKFKNSYRSVVIKHFSFAHLLQVELLRSSVTRTRIKVSVAIESLKTHFETYIEYDPMITQPLPSNPWITDDQTFWQLHSPLVEIPTEKRVKRWGLSMEELMSDPTGLQEFTNYLRKEYSHENIRFWLAVKDLRHSNQAKINDKVNEIFREFLKPGAPCEINIDGKTMEKVHQEMKNPTRFTFDSAAEHVYTLLLKKDCYPRFIRSDHYRNLLAAGVQPLQKKRFFAFGGQGKKKISTLPGSMSQQHQLPQQQQQHGIGGVGRRRGSDRSLSGSAHELAICGVRDTAAGPKVPHSHSQSNLTDIPYREVSMPKDDVCPWDSGSPQATGSSTGTVPRVASASFSPPTEASGPNLQSESRMPRKNPSQPDSFSSSSDVSSTTPDISERLQRKISPSVKSEIKQVYRNYSVGSAPLGSGRSCSTEMAHLASTAACSSTSFDLSFVPEGAALTPLPELELASAPCLVNIVPEETKQSPRFRTTKAPLISISAIVGEPEEDLETLSLDLETHDTSSDYALMSDPLTQVQSIDEDKTLDSSQLPTDTEKPCIEDQENISSEQPKAVQSTPQKDKPVEPQSSDPNKDVSADQQNPSLQQEQDNNVNEVCPWEDEENCQVDAPYVKTYATLGYL